MKPPIRILIVDDHAMVRFAISQAIQRHSDLTLVGEAENGKNALALYRKLLPDVVTMDFKLPDRDGDEVIAEIRAEFPEARIVLISIFENAESIFRATKAGAIAYVSKAAKVSEIIQAIRRVATGKPYFSEGLEEKLANRHAQENLTPRELEVLKTCGQRPQQQRNRGYPEFVSLHGETASAKHFFQIGSPRPNPSDRRRLSTRHRAFEGVIPT